MERTDGMTAISQPRNDIMSAKVRLPGHIVYRSFAAETVMLNLETGQYHGVNPVGGRMIEALTRSSTVREAAADLGRDFDVPLPRLEQDLCDFCSDLASRGLIELDTASPES